MTTAITATAEALGVIAVAAALALLLLAGDPRIRARRAANRRARIRRHAAQGCAVCIDRVAAISRVVDAEQVAVLRADLAALESLEVAR